MTSIERTAYPRFSPHQVLGDAELIKFYTLTIEELAYIKKNIRGDQLRLGFGVQLKVFQQFYYFPALRHIPERIIKHVKQCLGISDNALNLHYSHAHTLHRHRQHILNYLTIRPWCKSKQRLPKEPVHPARRFALQEAYQAAQTLNHPADIINVVIEKLIQQKFQLPTFYRLNRLAKHARALVNQQLFKHIYQQMDMSFIQVLDELLLTQPGYQRTAYQDLKQLPKRPTLTHIKEALVHHHWLNSFGNLGDFLKQLPKIKLQQFAMEAKSLDASDLRKIISHRRYTLMTCLIHHMQSLAKDRLTSMFCKILAKIHKKANEKLTIIREEKQQKTEYLLTLFSDILFIYQDALPAETMTEKIACLLAEQGGAKTLYADCEQTVAAYHNNYLPFLWEYYVPKRPTLFRLVRALKIKSASQNNALIKALHIIMNYQFKKVEHLTDAIDLSFASEQWKRLIVKKEDNQTFIILRYLEMAVFSSLANELRSGDIFIEGAEAFADYRAELLNWQDCEQQLNSYCNHINIPNHGKAFVKQLQNQLTQMAKQVDQQYPALTELVIDEQGHPVLKKREPKQRSAKSMWLMQEIRQRLPERNLLDILCNVHHYSGWAYEFGPLSGYNTKLENPLERYILTDFTYGTCLGPAQAARHIKAQHITAHTLSWINRRHVTPQLLDKSINRIINYANTFQLIKAWGNGKACAADGTLQYIREENLIAEFHLRYGHRGGIAYHHISDQYIALFSTFIPCGVWEAVAIIDGLLKNKSDIQPDTVHADTQGQSTVVFALAYLLGIKLMPRIRNWKDLKFFRPTKEVKYKHIDSLFKDTVDWSLIEMHWPDMMQVVLSIKAGKISSSLLLRKLGSYSRKNRLYKAFQELGYVIRTLFLLEYISNIELRETITATTNKVEAYHQLSGWVSFGSTELVASNDEDEMEKAVKYNDIITNAIILQNIIDISDIVQDLAQSNVQIGKEDLAPLSPYLTEHIKRFGDYLINLQQIPAKVGDSRALSLVQW